MLAAAIPVFWFHQWHCQSYCCGKPIVVNFVTFLIKAICAQVLRTTSSSVLSANQFYVLKLWGLIDSRPYRFEIWWTWFVVKTGAFWGPAVEICMFDATPRWCLGSKPNILGASWTQSRSTERLMRRTLLSSRFAIHWEAQYCRQSSHWSTDPLSTYTVSFSCWFSLGSYHRLSRSELRSDPLATTSLRSWCSFKVCTQSPNTRRIDCSPF
jgi:hypothetical protein